jgi:hypothetical protein
MRSCSRLATRRVATEAPASACILSTTSDCLGGRLTLESSPGEGAKIVMVLPRTAPIALA